MKSADRDEASGSRAVSGTRRLVAIFRSGVFLVLVCVAAFGLLLRSVRAEMREALWGFGAQVMEYSDAPHEAVRQLQLNGASLSFRTQTVDAPLADVLEHYEALCEARDAGLAEQLTTFLSIHSGAPSMSVGVLGAITTQTASGEGAGYVACLDMGDPPRGLEALASEFVRFAETGDLRSIGELRYVLARRVPNFAGEKTFLLTVWADAALRLDRMLPRDGADAAGRDPVGVPRPPGTQRILSAWEVQQPSSVFVYHFSANRATEVQSFYRRELPRNGWTIVERNPLESMEVDGIRMLSAENGDRLVTVLSHIGESSQGVLTIAISESP